MNSFDLKHRYYYTMHMIRLHVRFAKEEPLLSFTEFYNTISIIKDIHKMDSKYIRYYLYKVAIDKFSHIY